jgi:aminoglycoside N3'-acetyltransferase
MTNRERGDLAVTIARLVDSLGAGPVFVHADPFGAARLIEPTRNRRELLSRHLALIQSAAGEHAVWMPAFNYDYPKTAVFRVADDPCQLGPVPEQFRTEAAEWRTPIPIFSVAGREDEPQISWGNLTDPFGSDSIFAELVSRNGVILYYGRTFHYNTIVHYSERQAGGPPYRYDKIFPGTVVLSNGVNVEGSLKYHVRPLGRGLDYDWPGLLARAMSERVCVPLDAYPEILAASATSLNEFFIELIRRDPLGLLDSPTRSWVEPALSDLGRRFELSDFESPEPAHAQ